MSGRTNWRWFFLPFLGLANCREEMDMSGARRCEAQAAATCGECHCTVEGFLVCPPIVTSNWCDYGGHAVESGGVLPSIDDCNSCSCQPSGQCPPLVMVCTQLDCTGACSYAGRTYPSGTTFPSTDGCNQCSCANGEVNCAELDCACNPWHEQWRAYITSDSDIVDCSAVDVACPEGSSPFVNACGCGCEQSPDCPESSLCIHPKSSTNTLPGHTISSCGEGVSVCPLSQAMILE